MQGKTIVLGVSGSVAAYKAAALASRLHEAGVKVSVILTASASKFIGAATFRNITGEPVLIDLFDEPFPGKIAHIHLAQSSDLILIAPASANTVAKMALGLADDLLSTMLLAASVPIVVAPAMNTQMLANPATQVNLETLRKRGVTIVEPASGQLACGTVGPGRLAEEADILMAVRNVLARTNDLMGMKIVVTAGGTREPIDPVRFIGNRSSGKMGFAIAEQARRRGAKVILIAAHTTAPIPAGMEVIPVSSTKEMLDASLSAFDDCDVFIGAGAPADFAPVQTHDSKVKKARTGSEWTITLRETPDILMALAAKKSKQLLIGFAAETEDVIAHATEKLARKKLDLIAANDVGAEGAGFDADTNLVTLVSQDGADPLPLLSKSEVADKILDWVIAHKP